MGAAGLEADADEAEAVYTRQEFILEDSLLDPAAGAVHNKGFAPVFVPEEVIAVFAGIRVRAAVDDREVILLHLPVRDEGGEIGGGGGGFGVDHDPGGLFIQPVDGADVGGAGRFPDEGGDGDPLPVLRQSPGGLDDRPEGLVLPQNPDAHQ